MTKKVGPQRGRPKDPQKTVQILKAATGLFMAQGLKSTSMDAVAKKANVSKQTLYSHFKGKDDLYSAVIRDKLETYEFTRTPFKPSSSLEADLIDIGNQLLTLIMDEESVLLLKAVIAEGKNDLKTAQLFYDQGPEMIFKQLTAFLESQGIPDARYYTHCFFNMLERQWHMQALMGLEVQPSKAELEEHVVKCAADFTHMIARWLKD